MSLSIENFCTGTPRCFKNFRVSKNFVHKKWISRNSVDYFSSHSAHFFIREPCSVSESLWFRKSLCIKGRYHDFLWKIFVSKCQRISLGNVLCIRIFLVWKKIVHKIGISPFSVENFCLTVPKVFIREPFNVSESIDYRENFCMNGGYLSFLSKNICRSVSKVFVGIFLCIKKNLVSKKIIHKRALSPFSVEVFSSQSAENLHTRTLQCFRIYRFSRKILKKRVLSRL